MKLLIFLLLMPHYILAVLDTTWWKHAIMYEIYIWSFKDSNGDGIGDLNGITQKLDHIVDLGIDTIYLTPYFKSSLTDNGYDIKNFTEIEPLFGTMQDFDQLMTAVKERGLKVIADLVINHSSDEHPWFQKSIDRVDPYTNYYLWTNPEGYDSEGNPIPPNNWLSLFGGSGWEWNDKRKQFYFHQFAKKQPDLNLRNRQLIKEIKDIVKFWFDKGVSGLRLDATKHYIEDELLRDEPLKNPDQKRAPQYRDLRHIYTTNLWDSYTFIHKIRQFVDKYNEKHGGHERILIAEAYTKLNMTMAYYGTSDYPITHFPYSFAFAKLNNVIPAQQYDDIINKWLQNMPTGATANWVAENHDRVRIGTRLGDEYRDIITISIMTLPGVACIYYGQEIGMRNFIVRSDQRQDPNNDGWSGSTRDGQRLPMQWDNSINSGFSSSYKTWLPVNTDYWKVNVELEKATIHSRYNLFKTLSELRKSKALKHGDFKSYVLSKWVYSYVRSCKKCQPYIIILNLGTETEMFDLHDTIPNLPDNLKVVAGSLNAGYRSGENIHSIPKFPRYFVIRPNSGVVLTSSKDQHSKHLDLIEKDN